MVGPYNLVIIMESSFESVVNLLESYRGRDKVIRTICYGSQLVGGIISRKTGNSSQLGKSCLLFSAQLSHCRTVLRLFDDLSMVAYFRSYGLGSTEKDKVLRCMSVLINVADQLYYPCEHIAWAADAELIKVKSDKWWTLSTVLWGVSLLLGTLRLRTLKYQKNWWLHNGMGLYLIPGTSTIVFNRSFRIICKLRKKAQKCRRTEQGDSRENPATTTAEIQKQIWGEFLNILSSLADLSNAIHWMPPGFLWAGRFPDWLVGLMGTASSLLGILHMTTSD